MTFDAASDAAHSVLLSILRSRHRLPEPVRADAFDRACRDGSTRPLLLARADVDADPSLAPDLPEGVAALLGRPDVTGADIHAAWDASTARPRLLAALCRHLSPFRSGDYVPAVTELGMSVGGYGPLAKLAVEPRLTGEERTSLVLALESVVARRRPLVCSGWLPGLVSSLREVLAHDLGTARAIFSQVSTAPLLAALTPAALPANAEVEQRVCDLLIAACAEQSVSPSPHGISPGAAADVLTTVLPATTPQVAARARDTVLLTDPWPAALRMGQFMLAVPHAGPISEQTVLAMPWARVRLLHDPYDQLCDALAAVIGGRLGDSAEHWELLGRSSTGFAGTTGDLLDVVTGILTGGR